MATLEHVNITVPDPLATADMLAEVFGWHIRWQSSAMGGLGHSVHVGTDDSYLAVYSGTGPLTPAQPDGSYSSVVGLNHVGVMVDDLDATERAVTARGYATHSHADYEPGRRFYFHDENGVEFEVVSYNAA